MPHPRPPALPAAFAGPFATLLLGAILAAGLPAPAHAGEEAWVGAETRLNLSDEPKRFPRVALRLVSEARFSNAADGVYFVLFRAGPLLHLADWAFVGLHATAIGLRQRDDRFEQQYRLEVEPTFQGTLGQVDWADRNRVELIWHDARPQWRYRNLGRLNFGPTEWNVRPFVWNEVLFDLGAAKFDQNRFSLGAGVRLLPQVRLDAGWVLRSRPQNDEWSHDHVLLLMLVRTG